MNRRIHVAQSDLAACYDCESTHLPAFLWVRIIVKGVLINSVYVESGNRVAKK